ncbi:hypothetical protein K437DRAFT_68192 [Tilletiaria anomala UBC 951]|uniref:Uncharacterized protein n=1 Tax=Tilletiaria anomala (strain ATCC 24038 / CBS 436.72 / UBC 951) TaxID=1037660 RepID=A0A066V634_TILAU|nr:uncharacterized protein K437DRAFT_68192 [Tilletiaria anomala UBC 951]KDN35713.1 hypothetical protein K437DRAFT_68192 [Tilletiaria anomala UBC 951]
MKQRKRRTSISIVVELVKKGSKASWRSGMYADKTNTPLSPAYVLHADGDTLLSALTTTCEWFVCRREWTVPASPHLEHQSTRPTTLPRRAPLPFELAEQRAQARTAVIAWSGSRQLARRYTELHASRQPRRKGDTLSSPGQRIEGPAHKRVRSKTYHGRCHSILVFACSQLAINNPLLLSALPSIYRPRGDLIFET